MKKLVMFLCLIFGIAGVFGCSSANLDDVKTNADKTFSQAGFKIVGYEGYQFGSWFGGSYGGAVVYYTLERKPSNGILYNGGIQKWGNEYHIYGIKAHDAIRPNN